MYTSKQTLNNQVYEYLLMITLEWVRSYFFMWSIDNIFKSYKKKYFKCLAMGKNYLFNDTTLLSNLSQFF